MVRSNPNLGVKTLELPAGGREKSENAIQAAQCAFSEETGLAVCYCSWGGPLV